MDFAFKRIFGTEKYKAATIGLLNSIIPGKNIQDVSFINVEIPGMTEEGWKAFIDVLCTSNDGSTFVCEMQNLGHERFLQRMVFYAATLIANTAIRGNGWGYDLKPTGAPSSTSSKSKNSGKTSRGLSANWENGYILLSSASDLREIPQEFSGSTAFDAYFNAASTAAFSKDELSIYIKDMTTKWDIELAMKEHYRDGREEGLQEGLQQGREDAVAEMARRMPGLGLTLDIIAQATGLTPEQIQAL